MRIGFITEAEVSQLDWAREHGFGSVAWNLFETSGAGPDERNWHAFAEKFAEAAKSRHIRISAIDAHYRNPLDPEQSEYARRVFLRAIEVAAHLGIKTVCGFPGAVIELGRHPKGNNPVYQPFENYVPRLLEFWEPIAKVAAEQGVRLGFEHCPMGLYHLPIMGYNLLGQTAIWERVFNETQCDNLGLEWDASHLICQFIDPVANIHKFGSRIFHIHAKDAYINRPLLEVYGPCHPGVAEHRAPGFGQANWAEIVHALLRAGYDSDLNIEGWHDPVLRDHPLEPKTNPQSGQKLEAEGLLLAKRYLEGFVPPEREGKLVS